MQDLPAAKRLQLPIEGGLLRPTCRGYRKPSVLLLLEIPGLDQGTGVERAVDRAAFGDLQQASALCGIECAVDVEAAALSVPFSGD